MSIWPFSFERLYELLQQMPGIGKKSAQRIIFYILSHKEYGRELAQVLQDAGEKIRFCKICGNITDKEICNICTNPDRDSSIICVLEKPADLFAIESSGIFRGKYHILGGALSPIDGISPEDLRIEELVERVKKQDIKEVIIATNPTTEGEATAMYIAEKLKSLGVKISRIAQGLSIGTGIDLADSLTLLRAIEGRREIE